MITDPCGIRDRAYVSKYHTPPDVWEWLLKQIGAKQDDTRPVIALMRSSKTFEEYCERWEAAEAKRYKHNKRIKND